MLQALTDSLWISKAGTTENELRELCGAITAETQVNMPLEDLTAESLRSSRLTESSQRAESSPFI
jgi:hypothetical protein